MARKSQRGRDYTPTATARHQRFVAEYLTDFNGTAAALRAGYAASGAAQNAYKLLAKPHVQAMIRAAQEASRKIAEEQFQVSQPVVLRELLRVGISDVRSLFGPDGSILPMSQWPDDIAAAVASVETVHLSGDSGEGGPALYVKKIRLYDKVPALEKLGKHLGIFERDNRQKGAALLEAALAMVDGKSTNLIDVTPTRPQLTA